MALRSDVAEAVRAVSRPKSRRPVVIVRRAEDNGPTPERKAKDDYDDRNVRGNALRARARQNTVKALYDAGDIGAEALNAAEWWYSDWVFSTVGHLDLMDQSLPDDYEKGDVHTFAISRGHAGARISRIRERLGFCAHVILELMLAREMSFSAMARALMPDAGQSEARAKITGQCALILEQLAGCYVRTEKNTSTLRQKVITQE